MPTRLGAHELLDRIVDVGSFRSWDEPIDITGHPEDYQATLRRAMERTGSDESIRTGRARVHGREIAVIVNEFGFLAGSIGCAAADRIIAAVRRATAERLPLIASTSSGGTRMQEGTPAFVRMTDIGQAIMQHTKAGLPYLVHLRDPTTGGVFASWGSLGHVTVAEPEALIGFLGPRVYENLEGEPFPSGVQVSENLVRHGIVDAVVSHDELPAFLDRSLGLLLDPPAPARRARRAEPTRRRRGVWESIELTRSPERPGVAELLQHGGDTIVRLQGTDDPRRDTAMLVALSRIDGVPCVVVGQDRRKQSRHAPLGPEALRVAQRGMTTAQQLRLPVVSVIDTPGGELSPEAEEGAIAGEIARCIATMSGLTVPRVSVLLGEGSGGAALALLPADATIAAENAWLSPLPPEGASAIVHNDVGHAAEMAENQRVSAFDLRDNGVVTTIVAEPEGDDPTDFVTAVAAAIGHHLRAES